MNDSQQASKKTFKPKARVAKGFRDISPDEIRGTREMLATIQKVYESYGFEPVEQPFIEYTDALGKFLPDQDRPNAGVFSFQDDDDQWLSLRYDLTAPLARYVAENAQKQVVIAKHLAYSANFLTKLRNFFELRDGRHHELSYCLRFVVARHTLLFEYRHDYQPVNRTVVRW